MREILFRAKHIHVLPQNGIFDNPELLGDGVNGN